MKRVLHILGRGRERSRPTRLTVSRPGGAEPARSGRARSDRDAVDAAVIAYVDWRAACTAVRDAYRGWQRAPAGNVELAYAAYGAAVDREQAAAEVYAALMRDVGHLVESGLDYSLADASSRADAS